MAARIIKVAGLVVLAASLSAPFASASRFAGDGGGAVSTTSNYVNTPALGQGMKGTVVAPNDKAGTQGIGTSVDTIGMGREHGANLIKDAQAAKTPDERSGTSSGDSTPLVIPYLSYGIGVNAAQFNGSNLRPDDRAGAPPSVPTNVPTGFSAPVSTTGDGFNWGSAGIGAAGLAALALTIGLLLVLGRRSRHEGAVAS
jgi:hypothetical protein